MGLPVEVNNLMLGSLGGYTVGRSLRFRSSASAYLNRTPASASNRTTWTWSGWVKRGLLTTTSKGLFSAVSGLETLDIVFEGNTGATADTLRFVYYTGSALNGNLVSTPVYRDPSAWYHIVAVWNTTDATSSNRMRLYVNGVEVTAFGTSSYPTQNTSALVNNTVSHTIGRYSSTTNYFDGYLAEVNFIDGQALTPSSFGAYDTNGVWQPKKYSGTYGTNGFYLPFSLSATSSYAGGFNGSSQSLSGTLASAIGSGNFTIEGWVRQNTLTNYQTWFAITRGAGGFNIGTDASGNLVFYSSSARQIDVAGVMKTNQWQHIAFVRNGTTLTAYLNGIARATATVSTNFSATSFYIGSLDNTQEFLNASMSNLRLANTAVYTSNFIPSAAPLSAISGSILLTLQSATVVDNSGNSTSITNTGSVTMSAATPFADPDIAADYSGNVNNWTPNNISLTAGTTYDSMIDSPTVSASSSNYAVLNPLNRSTSSLPATIVDGNLKLTTTTSGAGSPGSFSYAFSTMAMQSGKYYAEFIANYASGSGGSTKFGLTNNFTFNYNGGNYIASNFTSAYTQVAPASIVQIAYDATNGLYWFGTNGTFTGDPAAGTGGTSLTAPAMFFVEGYNDSVNRIDVNANFGQRPFSYTPPSGYKALNTYNLPAPSIANGANNFDIVTRAGTGASVAISSYRFAPDFVWIKSRTNAYYHKLLDKARGANKVLSSNATDAESTETQGLMSFDTNGYTLGTSSDSTVNNAGSGQTYVDWAWKGGGTAVTNNSGTITSTVSANTTAGFSIVTYTGTGANATVGHGLGVAPSMIIVKNRSSVVSWPVYHANLTSAAYALYLNKTDAQGSFPTLWNSTAPTSTVFSLGTGGSESNGSGNFVAYCFSAVAGFSAFGKYTGNGSSDGPMIYTGFRPRYILIKSTVETSNWLEWDSSRMTYNVMSTYLQPSSSSAEQTDATYSIDALSNGFKLRGTGQYGGINNNGNSYVYACFAENPFNLSRAR